MATGVGDAASSARHKSSRQFWEKKMTGIRLAAATMVKWVEKEDSWRPITSRIPDNKCSKNARPSVILRTQSFSPAPISLASIFGGCVT